MKQRIHFSSLLVVFTAVIFFMNCGSDKNPASSSNSLVGTYVLVSFTDKTESPAETFNAGDQVSFGNLVGTFSGSLTITTTTFSFALTLTPQGGSPTNIQSDSGTYTISGNTITTVSGGDTESSTYTLSGNRLTLEDSETRIVFDKQ